MLTNLMEGVEPAPLQQELCDAARAGDTPNMRSASRPRSSASGMCESGRVVHHLKHALDSVDNTIVLIGFQGQHTLGRRLQEGHKLVRLFGQECERRAKIETLSGLSGHADVEDFKWFFEQMSRRENIGQAFLVHGEEDSSRALASLLVDFCDHDPVVPRRGETYEV